MLIAFLLAVPVAIRSQAAPAEGILYLGLLGLTVPLALASLVVAIIGLRELRREGAAPKGRGLGRTSVVASMMLTVVLGLAIAAIINGIVERTSKNARDLAAIQLERGRPYVDEELNFSFASPGESWVRIDAKKINPDACLAMVSRRPHRNVVVIAEKLGVEFDLEPEQLRSIAQGMMKANMPTARSQDHGAREVNGIPGVRWSARYRVGRQTVDTVGWAGVRAGYAYQIHFLAPAPKLSRQPSQAALLAEAARVQDCLRMLDPGRVAHMEGVNAVEEVALPEFGFRLDLGGKGWARLNPESAALQKAEIDVSEFCDNANIVLSRGLTEWMCVAPIYLMGRNPPANAVVSALLETSGRSDLADAKRVKATEAGLETLTATTSGDSEFGRVEAQLKVAVGEGYALLIMVFAVAEARSAEKAGGKVELPPLTFNKPKTPPDPKRHPRKERERQAAFLNALGIHYFGLQQYRESAFWFLSAFEVNEHRTYLNSTIDALGNASRFEEAKALLDKHADRFTDANDLKANRAWVLANLDQDEEAAKIYAALFEAGYRDDDHLGCWAGILADSLRKPEEALSALRTYVENRRANWWIKREADLLRAAGKSDDAIARLAQHVAGASLDADIAYTLIGHYRKAGRYREGADLAERLIKGGYASARSYLLRGRCELGLKWYKKAKVSFQAALGEAPQDRTIQEYLDHVSNILGEGKNTDLRTPIAPVELPAAVPGPTASDWTAKAPPDCGACYLRWVAAVCYTPEKDFRVTWYGSVKVLDESGVSEFSSLEFDFDPWREEIYVNQLTVFDAEGRVVGQGNVDSYYVLDENADEGASQSKVAHLPIPGLRPGYRIEFAYTVRRSSPPKRMPFESFGFSSYYPVAWSGLVLRADGHAVKAHASSSVTIERAGADRIWFVREPPRRFREPFVSSEQFRPIVALNDPAASWESVAKAYLPRIADRLAPSPEVKALAERLTTGLESDDARVEALARHVRDTITYKAIEFGRRAQIMNPTAKILADCYGDCKDHSLLLAQLLQAAGVPAHLALVRFGTPLLPNLASLDQFNHMIVFVPGYRGGVFLDATDKEADFRLSPPYGLAQRTALVIDPANPRLQRLGPPARAGLATRIHEEIAIDGDGNLDVRAVVTARGYEASLLRYQLKPDDDAARRRLIQRRLGGGAEVRELTIRDLEAPERPIVLEFRYRVNAALRRQENRLIGPVPAHWTCCAYKFPFTAERRTPFEFPYPADYDLTMVLTPAEGWSLDANPPADAQHAGAWISWKISSRDENGRRVIQATTGRRAGRAPAAEYAGLRNEAEAARRALQPSVAVSRRR